MILSLLFDDKTNFCCLGDAIKPVSFCFFDNVISISSSHIDSAALRAEAYRKRRGTVATCKMPCEKQLPSISAKGLELEAFHQNHVGKGGFDPCSIFRNTWR